MRAAHSPRRETLADLTWTAEQLYSDLLAAGYVMAASSVHEALVDLRRRVKEEEDE